MKSKIVSLVIGVCLLAGIASPFLHAQDPSNGRGTITAAGSDCTTLNACVILRTRPDNGSVSAQVSGTFVSTLQFEATADGINYVAIGGINVATGATATASGSEGIWQFNTSGITGFRVRASAYTSGGARVHIQPAFGAIAVRGDVISQGEAIATETTLLAVKEAVESELPVPIYNLATTSGGWDSFNATAADSATACTNSAQAVKASAGNFGGYYINNPNTADSWLQVYNVAAASVTVGTTVPKLTFRIPGVASNSVAANLEITLGVSFGTAMSIACTSSAGGNGAPSTALEGMIWFK